MAPTETPRAFGDATRATAQPATAQSMLLEEGSIPPLADWRQWFPEIIGRSPTMTRVLETVGKIARSDGAVLVLGESGTGKELIAAAIHRLSPRSDKPFVALNCSAIPDTLLESELFGHEKGAFTGADRKKAGKFQYAHGGTLFLDEIGDMKPALQAKLLRVLQDKKFALLGSNGLQEADVRVIAATNANLEQAIRAGTFREDLFYRLNVLPIQLPPLRDRSEDIPALLDHFVEVANRVHGIKNPCFLSRELIEHLSLYRWPGNIRQLENVVSRLVVLKGGGEIGASDVPHELAISLAERHENFDTAPRAPRPMLRAAVALPLPRPGMASVAMPEAFGQLPENGIDLTRFIEDLENDLIRQALERTGNNRNQAAKLLGLNRTTLVERIKKRQLTTLNEPSKEL
jgi:transcriptional regulator with PAS, ATPase and Fis domain